MTTKWQPNDNQMTTQWQLNYNRMTINNNQMTTNDNQMTTKWQPNKKTMPSWKVTLLINHLWLSSGIYSDNKIPSNRISCSNQCIKQVNKSRKYTDPASTDATEPSASSALPASEPTCLSFSGWARHLARSGQNYAMLHARKTVKAEVVAQVKGQNSKPAWQPLKNFMATTHSNSMATTQKLPWQPPTELHGNHSQNSMATTHTITRQQLTELHGNHSQLLHSQLLHSHNYMATTKNISWQPLTELNGNHSHNYMATADNLTPRQPLTQLHGNYWQNSTATTHTIAWQLFTELHGNHTHNSMATTHRTPWQPTATLDFHLAIQFLISFYDPFDVVA